jgi:hypothetical protein
MEQRVGFVGGTALFSGWVIGSGGTNARTGYVEFYVESKKEKEKTSRVSNDSRMVR